MNNASHVLPSDQFIALAAGDGGPAAIGNLVAAQHSRHLTLLYGVLKAAAEDGAESPGRLASAGRDLLALVQEVKPDVVDEVIRYPSFGAWALHALRRDDTIPGPRLDGLASVAAAAAIRAGVAATIEVPVTNGVVILPTLGAAEAHGSTAIVRTSPTEVCSNGLRVAPTPGSPGWQELRPFQVGGLNVLIDDLDPFRMPATDGQPTGRLAQPQVTALATMLREGWELLDPATADDIAALVRVIVPYQGPEDGYVSTTSPETFGTIALSQQPDRYMCAETLVHEAQHLKLCALLDLVRLTAHPDNGQRYYAPWRDDPRPASGLLQGAYAFLGVTGFWRRQRHAATDSATRQRADAEFARRREDAAVVVGTLLSSGQLTATGGDFVREMARVLADWRQEPVSAEALAVAERKSQSHLARWRARNGPTAAGVA
jgi:HEXXH motif-containing protein